ncbi:MAG: phosphoribosylamine--glycine ligase [Anaerolineae bacterium]|nr:phosphoribosylamine--glycine ligase [Anaerolineae bacterium]
MKILIVGSGGREHCLAWKMAQSPRVDQVYVAPGNGGTTWAGARPGRAGAQNVAIDALDIAGLCAFVKAEGVDLTVVGPEAPLVAGLVDAFQDAGHAVFGPTRAAAQLEGSKAFAKQFMLAQSIPTGRAETFRDYGAALAYLREVGAPIVVKASGLAAGKGVTVCATVAEAEAALHAAMVERAFGDAGSEVLIEERLTGQEASVLAFCDGRTAVPMVAAQDHKAAYDGDRGPNTGGMGCYAPAPLVTPQLIEQVTRQVLQPALDGMRTAGTPYVGVLYAGLMLSVDGVRVLEFNCRFGDPEAQVILPLLRTDLVDVLLACVHGRLDPIDVVWDDGYAACVVVASGGYPGAYETGIPVAGLARAAQQPGIVVYHAGTRREQDQVVTSGGRVLGVSATAPTLAGALERAYAGVAQIDFAGMHYRTDIGAKGLAHSTASAYAAAGVDIDRKMGAIERMKEVVRKTYSDAVLAGIGNFGGLYDAGVLHAGQRPVLVASTDGVGTKTKIAAAMGRFRGLGHDIVNHCINDILVQGAHPLFFMDYIASSQLDPDMLVELVAGCAEACAAAGCALLGGETAEMPGVYMPGEFDLVGTIVGWVEREAIVDGHSVRPGQVCLGLPSSGLHTNGYSLARRVFVDNSWDNHVEELGTTLGESLLVIHRSYLKSVDKVQQLGINITAMAHITGGGFPDNLPRVIPRHLGIALDRSAWEPLPIFRLIEAQGQIDPLEMYRVFNMGMGMVLYLEADDAQRAIDALSGEYPEGPPRVIGEVVSWDGVGPQVRL